MHFCKGKGRYYSHSVLRDIALFSLYFIRISFVRRIWQFYPNCPPKSSIREGGGDNHKNKLKTKSAKRKTTV